MSITRAKPLSSLRRSQRCEGAHRCRRKFLRFFPEGFRDKAYVAWERGYKLEAHQRWKELLPKSVFQELLRQKKFPDIANRAVRCESRTNLLFSFEKMALRDAVRSLEGAQQFSTGLYEMLHGVGTEEKRFGRWCEAIGQLPRKQTRVLTWPLVTVFGFLAQPQAHIFLKPKVTRLAAEEYGFPFEYISKPNWDTYQSLRQFAAVIRRDLRDISPEDMIDLQSFIWVQGSDEYED